jgi:FkbM family methyltransferase
MGTQPEVSDRPGSIAVRDLNGVQISYRSGTLDEYVLKTEYGSARFFPEGYQPPPNGTILDVGAHIGVFATSVARFVPGGVVHALEPSLENLQVLELTVRLYHAPSAIGHSFYHCPEWEGLADEPRPDDAPPLTPYEDVPAQTLAHFLAEQKVERVDFLKMNIEGAEYPVLLGAPDETLLAITAMQVELHPEEQGQEGDAERLIARLKGLGFRTEFVATDNPAVKGWLTARR